MFYITYFSSYYVVFIFYFFIFLLFLIIFQSENIFFYYVIKYSFLLVIYNQPPSLCKNPIKNSVHEIVSIVTAIKMTSCCYFHPPMDLLFGSHSVHCMSVWLSYSPSLRLPLALFPFVSEYLSETYSVKGICSQVQVSSTIKENHSKLLCSLLFSSTWNYLSYINSFQNVCIPSHVNFSICIHLTNGIWSMSL